jgi:hypothetical protein
LVRSFRPVVSVVAWLAAAAGGCGGRIKDDLPPLPPPNTPPIVAVHTATAAANVGPPPAPPPRPAPPPAPARPAPPAPPPDQISEPAVACSLSGRAPFPPNTVIQNAQGKAIARLSGADVTVSVSQLTLAARPRARVVTGTPRESFRVRGLIDAANLPVVPTAALPVRPGHLWIGERRVVSIQKVERDRLTVQREAMKPLQGTFTAVTTCGALSLDPGTPPGWSPPGSARGYMQRQLSLELYDAPGGASVGVLKKAPDQDAVLFFSTEERGGYVHVERHADIIVDAWVRTYDVSALPRGETMDQLATAAPQRSAARLAVPGEPRVAKTQREISLRASAQDSAAVIGSIAPDTDIYLVDVMAGWVSVLPRALDVMPAEGGSFWAKKTDLGL